MNFLKTSLPSFDFVKAHILMFLIAIFIVSLSIVGFFLKGINYGVDFNGGYIIEARMPIKPDLKDLRSKLSNLELGNIALQAFGSDRDLLIKFEHQQKIDEKDAISIVKDTLGDGVEYRKIETVGPKVGKELKEKAIKAIILALIAMFIYIIIRFEWKFALSAILALMHDCIGALGFIIITSLEFNETSIIAILTIAGYSINDTIIVFDRIRENMKNFRKMNIGDIINLSINETLSRTIMTSVTTFFALLALYFWGGNVIATFSLPIIIGILLGTFSSISIAAPILLYFLKNK
ncbi:MAG: protein translocase subunit SecF [Alphaproteobacteria bacterium]